MPQKEHPPHEPSTEPDDEEPSNWRQKKRSVARFYHSPRGWGDWLIATQAASIGLALLTTFLFYRTIAMVDTTLAVNGAAVPTVPLQTVLSQDVTASYCQYGLTLIAAVLLLGWFYRIVANLPRINAQEPRFSPRWAVAFFFVPFLNLLFPYNILQEAWRGSDPERGLDDGYSWRRNPITHLISAWWVLHLIAVVLEAISFGTLPGLASRDLPAWDAALHWLAFIRCAHLLDHLLLILLVLRLDKRQDTRRQKLHPLSTIRRVEPLGVSVLSPIIPAAIACLALAGMAVLIGRPTPVDPQAAVSVWQNFVAPDGRFTIEMPGKPTVPAQFASKSAVHYYSVQSGASEFAAIDTPYINGEPNPTGDTLRETLQQIASRILLADYSTIESTSFLSPPDGPGGIEGIEVRFTRDQGTRAGTARFFLHNGLLYEVVDIQPVQGGDPESSRRFQESFRLRQAE